MRVSSKETRQDHDDVSNDGNEQASSIKTGKESEIKDEKRSGDGPVNVAGKVDWTIHILEGIGDVIVMLANSSVVQ